MRNIKYLTCLFLLLSLLGWAAFSSGRVILFTPDTPQALQQHKQFLKKLDITEVIPISISLNWNDAPEELNRHYKTLNDLQRSNFKVHLQINLTEELPKWDAPDWSTVNARIYQLVAAARSAGIRGIILNTETNRLWNPAFRANQLWNPDFNIRYNNISDSFAGQIIYQRGREIMQAIEAVDPKMPVAVYPVGPLETLTRNYTHWPHFVNGLLSTRHAPGVNLIVNIRKDPRETLRFAQDILTGLLEDQEYRITENLIPFYQPAGRAEDRAIIQALNATGRQYILKANLADLL